MTVQVFSYGSNLCAARIRDRCPSATYVARGWVWGRRLVFHKRGQDGSGKADAHKSADAQQRVFGAIYTLNTEDKARLDRYEGLGTDYDLHLASVDVGGEAIDAWLYYARAAKIDPTVVPFRWYHAFVVAGLREFDAPASYLADVVALPVKADPDRARAARNDALLESLRAVD